jgi:hypothetical protein
MEQESIRMKNHAAFATTRILAFSALQAHALDASGQR